MKHDKNKTINGIFYTVKSNWLTPTVIDFINEINPTHYCDPFAGDGNLLKTLNESDDVHHLPVIGYDLNRPDKWTVNDSLIKIPELPENTLIVTNPPWLGKSSASKKGIREDVEHYYNTDGYNFTDLYEVALYKMIKSGHPFIALIPETLITTNPKRFPFKNNLSALISLQDSPFADTGYLTAVALYHPKCSNPLKIYHSYQIENSDKNYYKDNYLGTMDELESEKFSMTKRSQPQRDIRFNVLEGPIGVRLLDMKKENDRARFCTPEDFKIRPIKNVKTLRFSTWVYIDPKELENIDVNVFVNRCNEVLEEYRRGPCEILNCSFMENNDVGLRRRRVSFDLMRYIMEIVLDELQEKR